MTNTPDDAEKENFEEVADEKLKCFIRENLIVTIVQRPSGAFGVSYNRIEVNLKLKGDKKPFSSDTMSLSLL